MAHPTQDEVEKRHEAKARRMAKGINRDPEWANVHYTVDAKDNRALQTFNKVMKKQRNRKIN